MLKVKESWCSSSPRNCTWAKQDKGSCSIDWLQAHGAFWGADIEERDAILKKCNTSHSIKTDTLVTGKHGSHWGTGKRCSISPPIRTGVSEYISITGPHGTMCTDFCRCCHLRCSACYANVVECSWLCVCIEWSRLPVVKRTSNTHIPTQTSGVPHTATSE